MLDKLYAGALEWLRGPPLVPLLFMEYHPGKETGISSGRWLLRLLKAFVVVASLSLTLFFFLSLSLALLRTLLVDERAVQCYVCS